MFCNYPTEEGSLRFLKLAAGHIHHPPYTEQGFSLIKKEKLVSIPQFQQGFSKRKNPDKNVSFIIVTDSAYLALLTCKSLLILVLWYKPLTAHTQSIFLLLKYFPKYLNSVSLTFAPEMFSRLCPLTTFHDDAFRQTPNDRDAPLYYSQTASKEFYLSSAKKRHAFPQTFWIKVLLKWCYFVFPEKTCSYQCLTEVTWESTKPLACDVGQTISIIDRELSLKKTGGRCVTSSF